MKPTSLQKINEIGMAYKADREQWEAEQKANGTVPQSITVTLTWTRECRQYYSNRCPVCREFGGRREYQYTRSDGRLWLCQDCFEAIFTPSDEQATL